VLANASSLILNYRHVQNEHGWVARLVRKNTFEPVEPYVSQPVVREHGPNSRSWPTAGRPLNGRCRPEADVRRFKSRHPDQSIDVCRDPQTSASKTKVRGQRIREITARLRIRAARASSASMN
jgi:hypothetical protein